MKKIIIFLIIIMLLSFVISSCGNNDNISNESSTKNNTSSENEISEESQEESAEDESAITMPVGLTKIGDYTYLNLEGGNDQKTLDAFYGVEITFNTFDEMSEFVQKKEYTEWEQKVMAVTFVKNKYGIMLDNRDVAWVPKVKGYDIVNCAWSGDGYFHYSIKNSKGGIVSIHSENLEHYEGAKQSFDKYYLYEYIKENGWTYNHKQSTKIKNRIEYAIVDYESKIAYGRSGYFEFEKDNVQYHVYMLYRFTQKTESNKIKGDISTIQVLAKDDEKIWWYDLTGDAINEDLDYIASFQMELVNTRK